MVPPSPAWLALLLLPASAAAVPVDPPPALRVWATTHLELTSREVADEAGARWLEVEGRLRSDLQEPVSAAELRFERAGAVERCTTDATGGCRVRLRAPTDDPGWSARFDGGERLRPCEAPVPATARPAGERTWAVFLPLFVLAAGALAALGVFGARRLGPLLRRLRTALLRARALRRPPGDGRPTDDAADAVRRLRVLDALRFRPVAEARLVAVARPEATLAATDADGWAVLPRVAEDLEARAPGFVPEPVTAHAPGAGGREVERLALLRGRDALMVLLEAPSGPEGRPAGTWPESVLRIAGRVFPPAEAEQLARLCYRRAGAFEPADRLLVEALARRAAPPADGAAPSYPAPQQVLDALASEPRVAPRGGGRATVEAPPPPHAAEHEAAKQG